MLDMFRRGEVLPEGRTNEEEIRLVEAGGARGAGRGVTGEGPAKDAKDAKGG